MPYPDKKKQHDSDKKGTVASTNDFNIVCIRQINEWNECNGTNTQIDDSDIQISTCAFLSFFGVQSILPTPKPFCERPKCPVKGLLACNEFWWYAYWRRRLLRSRRCISWHWRCFRATRAVLGDIQNHLASKSLIHHSSFLICLHWIHFSTALNPFGSKIFKNNGCCERKSNRPALVGSGLPFLS